MKKKGNVITVYTSLEGIKNIEDALDEEVLRLTKGRKRKEYTPEELEEKKRRTEEDYNRIAEKLNRDYKNPERYMDRKHSGKAKFGKDIAKRLNRKKK
jgi:hypothetical protein